MDSQHTFPDIPEISDSYVLKKLLNDAQGLFINQIKEILENISEDEFAEYIKEVLNENSSDEVLESLDYYLLLFRDIQPIQRLLLSDKVPINLLEHLIMYSYGTMLQKSDNAIEKLLDHTFSFLSQEKYLQLLLQSENISNDAHLSFYILTKMKRDTIDRFFAEKQDLEHFIVQFNTFPPKEAKAILLRNPDLFGYIVMYLHIFDSGSIAEDFTKRYEADIVEMEKIKKISIQSSLIREKDKENEERLGQKSSKRLQFLISEINKLKDEKEIGLLLESNELFIDNREKALVKEILSNPMYKNILLSIMGRS